MSRLFVDDPGPVPTERLDTQNFNGFGAVNLSPASDQATRGSLIGSSTSNSSFSGQGE